MLSVLTENGFSPRCELFSPICKYLKIFANFFNHLYLFLINFCRCLPVFSTLSIIFYFYYCSSKNKTLFLPKLATLHVLILFKNDCRKPFATEKRPHVPFHCQWQMVPNALIEENVEAENAYPFVKHKICRSELL